MTTTMISIAMVISILTVVVAMLQPTNAKARTILMVILAFYLAPATIFNIIINIVIIVPKSLWEKLHN